MNIFKEFKKVCRDLEDVPEEKRLNATIRKVVEARLEKDEKIAKIGQLNTEKLSEKEEKIGKLETEKVSRNFSHISSILSLKGLGKNSSG